MLAVRVQAVLLKCKATCIFVYPVGYSKVSGSASMQVSQGLRGMWGMEMRSRAPPLRISRKKEAQAQVKDQE